MGQYRLSGLRKAAFPGRGLGREIRFVAGVAIAPGETGFGLMLVLDATLG